MKKVVWIVGLVLALLFQAAAPALAAGGRPESSSPPAAGTYVVQPGDSLYRIAARQGVDFNALMAANGFTSDKIILHPGDVLILPSGAAASGDAPAGPAAAPAAPAPGGSYVVQPGDSLYRIAARQGVDFSALMAANNFTSDKIIIYPGQVLALPSSAAASGAAGGGAPDEPAPAPAPQSNSTPGLNHLGTERVVIADYMMWYDASTFDGSSTWDLPSAGAYNSGDYAAIQRQVAQAQQACLDGFAAHWYGPGDGSTTNNFNQLLRASAGTNLRHAIVIQANILGDAGEQSIAGAIHYALDNWAYGPNYLRLGGRPVLIFTDMDRPWGSNSAAADGWARIRAAVDPDHNAIWMAEGLYPTFNPLFDGLYVYRIDHRDYPQAWLKQPRWAAGLRAVESQGIASGLYFADTISPGFDDTRSVNLAGDLRSSAPHFARDRQGGAYYADTFAVTSRTGGDFLFVKSFNEWVEGTEIEPGASYGDEYLNQTCAFANEYRGR
jgi:LysM repeat protein